MPRDSGGVTFNSVAAPTNLGELHAYPIKSPATIAQDQINRLRMLYGPSVKVKKDYSVRLGTNAYGYSYNEYGNPNGSPQRQNAQLAISFFNKVQDGLGLPLPRGAVRLYEPDQAGASRYIGAATIGDTPEKGRVDLTVSSVFDVTAETTIVKVQKVDRRHTRQTVKTVLSNRKRVPIELRVVEDFSGPWRIETESHKSSRLSAGTNQWRITIPAGGEVVLKFAVVKG